MTKNGWIRIRNLAVVHCALNHAETVCAFASDPDSLNKNGWIRIRILAVAHCALNHAEAVYA